MLLYQRKLETLLIMAALLVIAVACSAQQPAPATIAPPAATLTIAPAPTNAATPGNAATVEPVIEQSPLQPGTNVSPLQPNAPQSYVPLSDPECEALRRSMADTLNAEAQLETAGFRDYVAGVSGQGCLITVRGTGVKFPGSAQVARQLDELLTGQGWTVDPAYAADAPTGTLFGAHKDRRLALVDVGWIAKAGVNCPTNQPISACDIKPDQQIYTITVNAAQGK